MGDAVQDLSERMWLALTNSDRFRRFAKKGAGARLLHSPIYRRLHAAKRHVTSGYYSRKNPAQFQDVTTFCLFIGHNKSGSSMIGSLLDAHANIVLADEAGALRDVAAGFSRDQIYHYLVRVSRREAMKGRVTARRLTPYSFEVPGQWQGRYSTIRVIGDSTTGTSTQRFGADPNLVPRLQELMHGVDIKFIQVIRNPFDPISYMMVRGNRTFENAINHYFANCVVLEEMRKSLDCDHLFPIRYEDFIDEPDTKLRDICRFLGVDAGEEYRTACTSILRATPDRHRQMVDWSPAWIQHVQERICRYDFLEGYSFEI